MPFLSSQGFLRSGLLKPLKEFWDTLYFRCQTLSRICSINVKPKSLTLLNASNYFIFYMDMYNIITYNIITYYEVKYLFKKTI
jgi:hypothetical protein